MADFPGRIYQWTLIGQMYGSPAWNCLLSCFFYKALTGVVNSWIGDRHLSMTLTSLIPRRITLQAPGGSGEVTARLKTQ